MNTWVEALRERARAALPTVEGELRLPGLREPVEVVRERWGVPHIYARSLHDLFFAQGFTAASDRLFQIELSYRIGSGRLSEVFGPLLLPMDRFIRMTGWNRAGRRLTELWDDLSWEMAEAYTDGTRAWLSAMPARPVEYEVLQLDPWLPEGRAAAEMIASAGVYLSWSLSGNWDAELLRVAVAEELGWEAMLVLFPGVAAEPPVVNPGKRTGLGDRSALELLRGPAVAVGEGSNNWVVAGSRSATGMPLLANDPHLQAQLPSAWYEVHLSGPGIETRGVSLPFAPGVIIGHNERIAWGFTALFGDQQDLYLERLNDDGTAALYQGEWEPLAIHREEISVRHMDEPVVVEARETRHGPIVTSYLLGLANPELVELPGETYALRFVGFEEGIKLSGVHHLDTAADFEEFRAAAEEWRSPGLNFLYADVDGNIGYQSSGLHPIRKSGDGTLPVPGWSDEYEWDGFIRFEEMPWAYNPEEGFLLTANNKIHDDSYPYVIGKDFAAPFRARRIAQLLTETPVHDASSFARIQMDTVSLPAMEIVPHLLSVEPRDERQKEALAMLEGWDFDLSPGSGAAALYEAWCRRIGEAVLKPLVSQELFEHLYAKRQSGNVFLYQVLPALLAYPTRGWFGEDGREARNVRLRQALDAALDELSRMLGDDMSAWRWGSIHGVRFTGQLGAMPELAELFTAGEAPIGGDEQTVLQSLFEPAGSYSALIVPSWRQIVDLSDFDRSLGVNTAGQSGNPTSPHFKDQFRLWSAGEYHPMPFTPAAVETSAASTLLLIPG